MPSLIMYLLLIPLGLSSSPSWGNADSVELANRYQMEYQGIRAGVVQFTVSRCDDEYQVRAISDLSLLARAFLEDFTMVFRYLREEGGYSLQSGGEPVTGDGQLQNGFKVSQRTGRIAHSNGGSVSFAPDEGLDGIPYPLDLMYSGTRPGDRILLISPRRTYRSEVMSVTKERITVPAGTFDTVRIEFSMPDNADRVFRLWYLPDEHPIPARIISGRKGRLTSMELLP